MPLSAFREGERLESWSMSSDEWALLKRSYRETGLTMACGEAAVPKTSSLGSQFFAHRQGSDCQLHEGGPESPEHIATKIAVAEAARAIGWDAVIEFPAPDRSWIADVLVSRGSRTIAIEIQWSQQSLADFERRQARYVAAGIECLWLTTKSNARSGASTVPHFVLDDDRHDLGLWLPSMLEAEVYDLGEAIQLILQGGIHQVAEFIATHAIVATQMTKCWKCEKWMTLWRVSDLELESRCGERVAIGWPLGWELWASDRHELAVEERVLAAIREIDLPKPAFLARKYSSVERTHYIALNCPSCHIVQGDGLIRWRYDPSQSVVSLGAGARLPFSDKVAVRPHLCTDFGRGLCQQQTASLNGRPPSHQFPPQGEYFRLERSNLEV